MDTSTLEDLPTKNSADWLNLQNAAQQELARRNPNSLLDWSLAYRFFRGKPMRLIPALQDLHQDTHPFIVIQKAAQVFISGGTAVLRDEVAEALWPDGDPAHVQHLLSNAAYYLRRATKSALPANRYDL